MINSRLIMFEFFECDVNLWYGHFFKDEEVLVWFMVVE